MKFIFGIFFFLLSFASLASPEVKFGEYVTEDVRHELYPIPSACLPLTQNHERWEQEFRTRQTNTLRGHGSEKSVWEGLAKLQSALAKVEANSPSCFQAVSLAYALRSYTYAHQYVGQEVLLLSYLLRNGRLYAVKKSDRARWGGAWKISSKAQANRSLIMGAYDCEEGKIYFDPYLPPGDLAASIIHELNHLLRDKILRSDGLDLRTSIVADEALSAMAAALYQINTHDIETHSYGDKNNDKGNFDFTLYSRDGDLRKQGPDFAAQTRIGYAMKDLRSGFFLDGPTNLNLRNTFAKVESQYMGPQFHDESIPQKVFQLPIGFLDPLFDFNETQFRLFEKALEGPSAQCREFMEASKAGRLNEYLGSKVPRPMTPGSEGTRPGSEGTRPGSEGTRPGSEGTRPSRFGVKPCLLQSTRL